MIKILKIIYTFEYTNIYTYIVIINELNKIFSENRDENFFIS